MDETNIKLKVCTSLKDNSLITLSEAAVEEDNLETHAKAAELTGRLTELITAYHGYKLSNGYNNYNIEMKKLISELK